MAVMHSHAKDGTSESLHAFQEACKLREKVVKDAPDHPGYRFDLALTWRNVGAICTNLGRNEEALAAAERAAEEGGRLMALAPQIARYRHACSNFYQRLSERQWKAGRHAPALASARARAKLWPKNGKELYAGARDLSGLTLTAKSGKQPQMPALHRVQAEELVIDLLKQALTAGFRDLDNMATEEAFAFLRLRADFQQILAGVK
jgi:tetratricopeptide (TPR) repeat protein